MEHPKLATGRIVHYRLSKANCEDIDRRREANRSLFGNAPREGGVVPAIVVHPWSDTMFNGQAFLDGNDTLWLSSVEMGEGPGTWFWPPRD